MPSRLLLLAYLFAALFASAADALAQPYKRVPVTVRDEIGADKTFAAFRETLKQIAAKRDLAALKGVMADRFFWQSDFGGGFNKAKSPVQNLSAALVLSSARGWKTLARIANGKAFAKSKFAHNELCGPSRPTYAANAFKEGDEFEWGYVPEQTTFRKAASAQSPAIGSGKGEAIRVVEWAETGFSKVRLPDGQIGYAHENDLRSLREEQLCFRKTGEKWLIVGYVGGGD